MAVRGQSDVLELSSACVRGSMPERSRDGHLVPDYGERLDYGSAR